MITLAITVLGEQKLLLKWDMLNLPPYSPDLVPSDYHLLIHIKKWLGGQHFDDGEELQNAVTGWLNSQATEFYGEGI
ncbi:hypothetical protein AVEN_190103-1, partial [Araneus ventricosus]